MKSIQNIMRGGAVAAALLATLVPSPAQNTNHTDGDLVLFFQNPGGSTNNGNNLQLFANLGNTATVFRDAYSSQRSLTNIINIGSELSGAFGSNWASSLTLYGGLGGVWSSSSGSVLQNGDPSRTAYTSLARNGVGTEGEFNTVPFDLTLSGNGAMTTMASAIIQQNNIFETGATSVVAAISNGVGATIGGINPVGDSAWNAAVEAPGVQQQGTAGGYGVFGPATNAQFMWDLYRLQARGDVVGQFDEGGPIRQGLYLGTVVLDEGGDISFVAAVPEPSTWALLAVGAIVLGGAVYARSRRPARS